MSDLTCDVLVVGGGPGGYPAAIRAGQLGLDTIIVDLKVTPNLAVSIAS